MPFWERFQSKEASRNKLPEKLSEKSPIDALEFSLQSFGLALLQHVSAQAHKQNVFISPLSVFLALAMTENGASGETKAAMRKALALPAYASAEAVNLSAAAVIRSLLSHGEAEVAIASALWTDINSTISPDFVTVCQNIYDAGVQTIDLTHPSSAHTINAWISQKTAGKISEIVTPNSIAGLPAILTNALYFKGKFSIPFPKEATRPTPFHLADGREKEVPMMRISGLHHSYRSGARFEAAVLQYRQSPIALYMLLPAKGARPEQILTEQSLRELQATDESVSLDLSMPRFNIDFASSLKESLSRQGMGIAFQSPGADFSAIGSPLFFLGDLVHKTRLEVDEAGTVAAASTTLMVALSAMRPPRIKNRTLVFDRPFAILLRHRMTGAIIFVGVVYEP
jgi:serine protease inhibitor